MEETNNRSSRISNKTRILAGMGLLTAITVVLELFAGFVGIRFGPFNITLALAPTIVGAALYGWKASGWLGFVFSFIILFEPATTLFMTISAPATILVVLVKGTAAGLVGGLVYSLVQRKNRYAAVVTAGVVTPLVNTGIFVLGCLLFFADAISQMEGAEQFSSTFAFILVGFVGLNFFVELAINLALASAIVVIINIATKRLKSV